MLTNIQSVKKFGKSFLSDCSYVIAVAASILLFWLYTYNSGYGYDGLEHLVVGQSLSAGFRFYDLPPSLPYGLYSLIWLVEQFGISLNHISISTIITILAMLPVSLTIMISWKFGSRAIAIVAGIMVFIAAAFMELNFFVTEGIIAALGLLSVVCLTRKNGTPNLWASACAGIVIGIGFQFKQSAAFYGIGTVLWLFFTYPKSTAIRLGIAYILSAAIPVFASAIYFAATGRLQQHLEWTYYFPLSGFPSSTEYASKLFTKLGWFSFLMFGTILSGFIWRANAFRVLTDPYLKHLLLCGSCALYPLTKSQAPHYLFPSATFLLIVCTFYWSKLFERDLFSKRNVTIIISIIVAIIASLYIYRPSAIFRLISIKEFQSDEKLIRQLNSLVPLEKHVLFLTDDSLKKYFLIRRYPNIPLYNFDVQCKKLFANDPNMLSKALTDPTLTLIEFDPKSPPEFRLDTTSITERTAQWSQFETDLNRYFKRKDIPGMSIWERKDERNH